MRASQARYVTACQQLLALGLVLAALTPAASVISLDIVGAEPGAPAQPTLSAEMAAYQRQAALPASVETAPVDPKVSEIQLTAPRGGRTAMSKPLAARSMAAGHGRTRVVSQPQPVVGFGAVGVTWDPTVQVAGRRHQPPGAHPHRGHLVRVDRHRLRRRPRPGPRQRRGPARPPRHRRPARRPGRPGAGAGHLRGGSSRRHAARRHRPRPGQGGRRPPGDRHRLAAVRPGRVGRLAVARVARGRGVHPGPDDLQPRPVGRRRAGPRGRLAAVLRGARRLRAPHGERQQLLRGRRARADPEHLRVPHPVEGLERHRLQLPGRPLRPGLGGPVRRSRPPGRRRPHARLQRVLLRDVGHRQLRDHPAVGRGAAGLRRRLRLEAVAARRQRRVDQPARRPLGLPGHQRPPRRRPDGLPGQVPLRPDPADPAVRRGRADRLGRARARVQPGRQPAPGHRRAAGQ